MGTLSHIQLIQHTGRLSIGAVTFQGAIWQSWKAFVRELARLFQAYVEGSAMESVALTRVMVMPALLLQRPHQSSKVKEHISCLERRLKAWSEVKIDLLLHDPESSSDKTQKCQV